MISRNPFLLDHQFNPWMLLLPEMLRHGRPSRRTQHPTLRFARLSLKNKIPNSASRRLDFTVPCGRSLAPLWRAAAAIPHGAWPRTPRRPRPPQRGGILHQGTLPAAPHTAGTPRPGRRRLALHLQAPGTCSTIVATPLSPPLHVVLCPPPRIG
jgi:hypothetical protein